MATLVLTTVGSALGGPVGGALGSLVGGSIEQGLTGRRRRGPRMGDLSVQTSSYGSPIPRIYGTMRVAGTVIWATDLREEETIEGGGKGSPERLAYSYSANLAVALSSRPIRSVGRIWADGKLIRGEAGDFKVKTGFRLARGIEDQAVDPLIASVETISLAPAYRGLALAIFEDFELAEFGNRIPMLTFEVMADEDPQTLGRLLTDVSGGVIETDSAAPVRGFAAHGSSMRDAIEPLVALSGIQLADEAGHLRAREAGGSFLIASEELGCAAEETTAKVERERAPVSTMLASLTMNFYDQDRDYQAGQAYASAGQPGRREEQVELPAVLRAVEARHMVESTIARRFQTSEKLKLRLPPSRMAMKPGDKVRLAGEGRSWSVAAVSIERMAVVIEAEPASTTIPALPADGGRPVSEPDVAIGRSKLALFELPADGDAPASSPIGFLAAINEGRWKALPIELQLAAVPLPGVMLGRRTVIGRAVTRLDARAPAILDQLSTVTIELESGSPPLFNADRDALTAGANLALIGDELIQFGSAEQLAAGRFRLSNLLRGRRGTEWAVGDHVPGEIFCQIDRSTIGVAELPASAVGAMLTATAHGIGDVAPLPQASRAVTAEAMRPPSPCNLQIGRAGPNLTVSWTRRSYRNWAWTDDVGDRLDDFPERYRLTLQGRDSEVVMETSARSIEFAPQQTPGRAGETIGISVVTIGPAAVSRPATATIIL